MPDLRHFSKAFMADFIDVYNSYSCLWKTKGSDYKNRNKKDTAYTVLLKELQEIEPNATKQTVKDKINSIRGSFRKEMKKIEGSKRSGVGADEIYETHLWYYKLLLFTKDQEMPRESVRNLVQNREGASGSEQESDDEGEKTEEMEYVDDEVEQPMSPPTRCISCSSVTSDRNQHIGSPSTSSATSKSSKRKRKTKVDEQADEILTMVGERLRNDTTNNEDAFNIFGKHVAAKLRTLPKQTKLYTEKLITDLLFEAEIGNIDKNTKIVTLANKPTNLIDADMHANNDIMVDGYPRNYYNSSQPSEYSRPATYRPIQEYQSSQSDPATQFLITPAPQQHTCQSSQSAPTTPQSHASVTFFGSYRSTEDYN